MEIRFSFNTRMLVLLALAQLMLIALCIGLGVVIGRAWAGA